MKLGILSDTHDNLPYIEKAVAFFNAQGCDFVLHAGDFVAPFVVPLLGRLACDWRGVFGNNDGDRQGLAAASAGRIQESPLRIELGGRLIAVVHDIRSISQEKEEASCIVFGHTHKPQVSMQSGRLLVNPGECSGWLFGAASVAVARLEDLSCQIVPLP